jgi:hypothetical protein
MLFAAKSKGYFVQQDEYVTLLARTSASRAPMVVEELLECPLADSVGLGEALRRVQPKRSPSGYVNAVCGVSPANRLLRHTALDPKRLKEPGYLTEVLASQFRVEPEKYLAYVLNAPDGADFDVAKPTHKDAFFCGIPTDEIVATQDRLLAQGVYPDRLELTSVATLGAVADYLTFRQSKVPTLVLEIGNDITQSFIVSAGGLEASRPVAHGLRSMVPVVQKELGLKDEESAKKLFFSGTFDFTGMGPVLVKKLLKELQSSIGFYEVQTGQSVGQLLCLSLPPKLAWLGGAIATALGIAPIQLELVPWLQSRQITVPENVLSAAAPLDVRWFGLLSLMVSHDTSDAALPEKKA